MKIPPSGSTPRVHSFNPDDQRAKDIQNRFKSAYDKWANGSDPDSIRDPAFLQFMQDPKNAADIEWLIQTYLPATSPEKPVFPGMPGRIESVRNMYSGVTQYLNDLQKPGYAPGTRFEIQRDFNYMEQDLNWQ